MNLKISSILAVLLLLFLTNVHAQNSRFSIGAVVSQDAYEFKYQPIDPNLNYSFENVPNFSVGLMLRLNLAESWAFRTGLLFSAKDIKQVYDYSNANTGGARLPESTQFNIAYLDVPLLLQAYLNKGKFLRFYVAAGAVGGVNIVNSELTTFTDGTTSKNEIPLELDHNSFVWSAMGTVGLQMNLGRFVGLTIEPYYRQHFSEIAEGIMEDDPSSYGVIGGLHIGF